MRHHDGEDQGEAASIDAVDTSGRWLWFLGTLVIAKFAGLDAPDPMQKRQKQFRSETGCISCVICCDQVLWFALCFPHQFILMIF